MKWDSLNNGCVFGGSGFLHNVYFKDDKAYKMLKMNKAALNNSMHFLNEMHILKMLRANGYPSVHVYRIYNPAELVKGLFVLEEERSYGINYTENEIPQKALENMFCMINSAVSIIGKRFGKVTLNEVVYQTWKEFLISILKDYEELSTRYSMSLNKNEILKLIDLYVKYDGVPHFLVMDLNTQNFLFDAKDSIIGIIDIDHPLFGDPYYQVAANQWYMQGKYDMYLPDKNLISKELMDIYILFIGLEDIIFRIISNEESDEIINKYKRYEKAVIENM